MKIKVTKRIKTIRSWSEQDKQRVLKEAETILKDFSAAELNDGAGIEYSRKCSAKMCQLTEAGLQFKKSGIGIEEVKAILWDQGAIPDALGEVLKDERREKDLLGFAIVYLIANLPELELDGAFENCSSPSLKATPPTEEELKDLYTKLTGKAW